MYLYLFFKKKIGNFYEIKQNKKEQNDYNSWILKGHFKNDISYVFGRWALPVCFYDVIHDRMKLCGSTLNHKKLN